MSDSCKRDGCPGTGIWIPVLVLHQKRGDDGLRARMPNVEQCELHKDSGTIEDFLSPEGWDKLQRHLREAGKGRYAQRLTTLEWEPAPGRSDACLPF